MRCYLFSFPRRMVVDIGKIEIFFIVIVFARAVFV